MEVSVFDQIIAVLAYVCYTLMIGQLFQFSVRMLHYDTLSASIKRLLLIEVVELFQVFQLEQLCTF